MRTLLVEDDPGVAASTAEGLTAAGFEVEHLATGGAALDRLAGSPAVDVVILDLGLPDMDGQDVCRAVRAASSVPVVIVSARGEEVDLVVALELGADDYLVKPFGIRELVARIRAVVRRTSGGTAASQPAQPQSLGRLTIDRRAQRVFVDGDEVSLTAKEFDVLAYLAEDPGAVHRRLEILERVWDAHWYGPTKTLDAHVAAIRKKLGDSAWIEAVRGVGFRLGDP